MNACQTAMASQLTDQQRRAIDALRAVSGPHPARGLGLAALAETLGTGKVGASATAASLIRRGIAIKERHAGHVYYRIVEAWR